MAEKTNQQENLKLMVYVEFALILILFVLLLFAPTSIVGRYVSNPIAATAPAAFGHT